MPPRYSIGMFRCFSGWSTHQDKRERRTGMRYLSLALLLVFVMAFVVGCEKSPAPAKKPTETKKVEKVADPVKAPAEKAPEATKDTAEKPADEPKDAAEK